MTDAIAITGTYSDFKVVKTRKVAQMVIEIPIEGAQAVIEKFGIPLPHEEQWVAIALLNSPPESSPASPQVSAPHPAEPKRAERTRPTPLATKIAMLCQDRQFQEWLGVDSTNRAAVLVRQRCGVKSRSEIEGNPEASTLWNHLHTEFEMATGRMAERIG